MPYELGDVVYFSRSLSRQRGNGVDPKAYTDEQSKQLEGSGFIELVRYKERNHNEKKGFICGKRNIVTSSYLSEVYDNEFGEVSYGGLAQSDEVYEAVYVVACDMRGLYRVRKEDLEVIKCHTT